MFFFFFLNFAQDIMLIFCSNNSQGISDKQTNHSMNEILNVTTKQNPKKCDTISPHEQTHTNSHQCCQLLYVDSGLIKKISDVLARHYCDCVQHRLLDIYNIKIWGWNPVRCMENYMIKQHNF
jgi:hypothetical protein